MAGRRGGAGTGRTSPRDVSPRTHPILLPSRISEKTIVGVSLQARTIEFLCNPMEEQKPRLIGGTTSALRSLLLTRIPSLNCLSRPVECKTRTYHGRVGVGRRAAGWPGDAGPCSSGRRPNSSSRRQPTTLPSRASRTTVLNVSEHEQRKSNVNRWGNTITG